MVYVERQKHIDKIFCKQKGGPFVSPYINMSNMCLFVHPFQMHLLITRSFIISPVYYCSDILNRVISVFIRPHNCGRSVYGQERLNI